MVNTYEGLLTVTNEKFCIVISRFNEKDKTYEIYNFRLF